MAVLADALLMLGIVGSSIARCESSSLLTRTTQSTFLFFLKAKTGKTHDGIG